MKLSTLAALALSLLQAPGLHAHQAGDAKSTAADLRRADAAMRSRRWERAAEAYERVVAVDPANGQAWFQLGSARHQLEDWPGAIQANRRAAEFAPTRASALYNVACAQSLAGHVAEAATSLEEALAAGFADYDLVAGDADLAHLRAARALPLPEPRDYREERGRNGVRMPYAVVEPDGFDADRTYPVLVALAPGGTRSADWMLGDVLRGMEDQGDWIVVCIAAPERGWFTHPTHHALEDVLDRLRKDYEVEGERFHLFGIVSGCRAATTYSRMSGKYFQSMTLVSSLAWQSYDDSDWRGWRSMPVLQIVGAEAYSRALDEAAHGGLTAAGVDATLVVVPDAGPLVEALRGPELLTRIDAVLRPATERDG